MQDWDKPEYIADPDATQPEDWDEDMDGEWEPPMIPNPDYNGTFPGPLTRQASTTPNPGLTT